jgi:hypothetical protein
VELTGVALPLGLSIYTIVPGIRIWRGRMVRSNTRTAPVRTCFPQTPGSLRCCVPRVRRLNLGLWAFLTRRRYATHFIIRFFRLFAQSSRYRSISFRYATRLSAGGADEWVTQLLRQGDAKIFKEYSQMKLQMK